MKVVFALRFDASAKPGGDTKKVQRYREELSRVGINSHVVTDVEQLSRSDAQICHLVNLDLPIENRSYSTVARRRGMKVALSTVSHPIDGLTEMYAYSDDRYFNALRTLGIKADRGLVTREVARLSQHRRRLMARPMIRGLQKTQQELLDNVDVVLPMAPGETRSLQRRFHLPNVLVELPNGLNFEPEPLSGSARRVCVVGRVEPRKNTLEIARWLAASQLECDFAGALNPRHAGYCSRFLEIVQKSRNLTYHGLLDRPQLSHVLKKSGHYLNASWCEVVSQADLEAASKGCSVVSTKHSYLGDFLRGSWRALEPRTFRDMDPDEFFSERGGAGNAEPLSVSWRQTGQRLATVYRELM